MRFFALLINIAILILLSSCANKNKEPQGKIIVKYGNEYLLEEDIIKKLPKFNSQTDSINYVNSLIDAWLEQKLFFDEAKIKITDTSNICRKVEDYRKNLYVNEYLNNHVYNSINDKVSRDEIEEYYNKYLDNYKLSNTYVKAHYMTILDPKASHYYEYETVRKSSLEDEKELIDYCIGTGRKVYFLKDWIELDDFLEIIHYQGDINGFSQNQNFVNYVYDDMRYLVKIDEIITEGDTMPLELAETLIYQVIIKNRKDSKYQQVKNELKTNAINSGKLVIN